MSENPPRRSRRPQIVQSPNPLREGLGRNLSRGSRAGAAERHGARCGVGFSVGRASTILHKHPTPDNTDRLERGLRPLRAIGPGYYVVLFRILQVDFAEFPFHALR